MVVSCSTGITELSANVLSSHCFGGTALYVIDEVIVPFLPPGPLSAYAGIEV